MSHMPRVAAAPAPAGCASWPDLLGELDRWRTADRIASLWWRDDDAVEPTAALARLLDVARGVPIGLAVVPGEVDAGLAEGLAAATSVAVLQHGWRHANHGGDGKKSEYPASRSRRVVAAELATARARLAGLFGGRALPLFVPPWNRFADAFLPLLPEAGIAALSSMARPIVSPLPAGIARLDVHLDLVAWRQGGGFIGVAAALGGLVGQLWARRTGLADPTVPTGILTHHLVTDDAGFEFLAQLADVIRGHQAACWVDLREWTAR